MPSLSHYRAGPFEMLDVDMQSVLLNFWVAERKPLDPIQLRRKVGHLTCGGCKFSRELVVLALL